MNRRDRPVPRLSLTPPRKSLLTSRSKSQMVSSMLRSFSSSQVTFSKTNVWFQDGLQLRLMTGLLCEEARDRSGSRQLHARHAANRDRKCQSRFKHSHYFRFQHSLPITCCYCRYSMSEVQVSASDLSLSASRVTATIYPTYVIRNLHSWSSAGRCRCNYFTDDHSA